MTVPASLQTLLGQMPLPPGEVLPDGIDLSVIALFCDRTGISLPPEFAEWLTVTNGPCVGPGGVFGIATLRQDFDIERLLSLHPQWQRAAWLPVAGDGCGNYYLLAATRSFGPGFPVFFVDTMEDPGLAAFIVGSGFFSFLESLFLREMGVLAWPFDRDSVLRQDPGIADFALPLPWEVDEG